jgi:hypothetical protein
VLDQQLLHLPARSAGLEADFQKRMLAFKALDDFLRSVAAHGRVPDHFTFFARFLLQRFCTRFLRQPVELIKSFFGAGGLKQRWKYPDNAQEHSRQNSFHACFL